MDPLIFVVFGIPGAGKTTIARSVAQKWLISTIDSVNSTFLPLDLDDCIPQWMRDNFSVGIYPTLAQRLEFAKACCDYVDEAIYKAPLSRRPVVVVSFSFVNQDLRQQFRKRFPSAQWILIDTTEEESQKRMEQRTNHFYKGKTVVQLPDHSHRSVATNEWNFDTVTFPHTILNGQSPIEENASKILAIMKDAVDQSLEE